MKFYIVGSALSKKAPRDIDMYGVMDEQLFEGVFGLTAERFQYWRRIEHTAPPNTYINPNFVKWQDHVLGATRVLQFVYPGLVPLDFKFLPESLLQEPNKEIDISTSPTSWGINLPKIGSHGVF